MAASAHRSPPRRWEAPVSGATLPATHEAGMVVGPLGGVGPPPRKAGLPAARSPRRAERSGAHAHAPVRHRGGGEVAHIPSANVTSLRTHWPALLALTWALLAAQERGSTQATPSARWVEWMIARQGGLEAMRNSL